MKRYLGALITAFFLLLFISCKKEQTTQIRFQNVDPIHDFTEFKFGNIFSSELKNGETTGYLEIIQGEYHVEWEFYAWGTYLSSNSDDVTIIDNGRYTLKVTINNTTLVKD